MATARFIKAVKLCLSSLGTFATIQEAEEAIRAIGNLRFAELSSLLQQAGFSDHVAAGLATQCECAIAVIEWIKNNELNLDAESLNDVINRFARHADDPKSDRYFRNLYWGASFLESVVPGR